MSPAKDEPIFPQKGGKKAKPIESRTPLEKELDERDPDIEKEAELRKQLQEQLEEMRHKVDPDYKPRARAEFLRSVKVEKSYSPANRVAINKTKGDPNAYRFNNDEVRDRIGMEGWVAVTDIEEAKRVCPSAHLREGPDGKIYSGDSYLCKQPEDLVEQRNAAMFAKAERSMRSAEQGEVALGTESFGDMHRRTATSDDPVGIRFKGKLSEDKPSQEG